MTTKKTDTTIAETTVSTSTAPADIAADKKAATVSVVLLKPHTHKNVTLPVGATLDVTEPQARFLAAHGVIAS